MKLFGRKQGTYQGRHTSPKRRKGGSAKNLLSLCLALILAVCLTIGGTLAFMQEKTDTVTNTFKAGNITYTLNLDPNAKNVVMPTRLTAQSTTSLSAKFELNVAPTKTGYTFGGWYYDPDCTDTNLHTAVPGTSITVKYGDEHDEDNAANKVEITLYAKWVPNTNTPYEVRHWQQNVDGGEEHNDTNFTLYEEENMTGTTDTEVTPAVKDYVGFTPPEAQTVTILADGSAVVDYYYTRNSYIIELIKGNGIATVTGEGSYKYGASVTIDATLSNGYKWLNWTGTHGTDTRTYSFTMPAANVTDTANGTPISYTVVYNNNVENNTGVTGTTENSSHTYDVAKPLTKNGYARTGYTFIGWNTKADGTGTPYADEQSVINLATEDNGLVNLYAQWGAKSYVLHYHANGGFGTMQSQTIQYDVPTDLHENQFTRTDHSFMGWALEPNGEVKYIDKQTVVNLLESGVLDLYAVWGQDSHTVYFNYNGGTGSPASKQFQYGKSYGQLPEYPVHPTKVINDNEVMSYLFTGWYTKPAGGTRVYPYDIANTTQDHTLYAHWEEAPTNNVIQDIVVKNNPDDDNDGVVDDVYLNLKCSSTFEKFNIPLKNLMVGQTYRITYNASNNASFGDYISGYQNSVYGSYIVETKELTGGRIDTSGEYGVDYFGMDLLATWNDRMEPDGSNDGNQAATNDTHLQGPWSNRTIEFTATKNIMYWVWDFGLMQDGILNDYNILDIVLEPVAPEIKFDNKLVVKGQTSPAGITDQTNDTYGTQFTFDGDSGTEAVYYPITGLSAGMTYTITFDHEFSGPLIHDTKTNLSPSYEYGCGIMNDKPTKAGSKMTDIGTFASKTFVKQTVDKEVDGVTLTFKATGSTAYWVWNMANCSDSTNTTTKVTVTSFSASNAGKTVMYHTSASNAGSAMTLDLRAEEKHAIQFAWDGIDDTNMDIWYPVDEQYPTAGDSYELAFEPSEGFTMAEFITVVIDDVIYQVATSGQTVDGTIAPVYDPQTNVLTIPAECLTSETGTVAITASAVPVEHTIPTEPEKETEPAETEPTETEPAETVPAASEPTESAPVESKPTESEPAETETEHSVEDTEIEVALNLTNMTAQGDTVLQAGEDFSRILVPDDGYQLPEVIRVEIDDTLYEVYTDGLEHRTLAEGEEELPPMPTHDPAAGTLTIPAILLDETTQNVTITISAVEVVNTTETESSGKETETTTDGSEPTTASAGDAALPPKDQEEEEVPDDGGDNEAGDENKNGTAETTEGSSQEVAEK